MVGTRLSAYQGNGGYIFASYCHKDEAVVLPLLGELAGGGVNVWYDEGIVPGDEWPQVIQDRIEGCSVFVAFVSSASQLSHNCRRELNEALTLGKPTIPVLLEDCEKSLATEALLSRLQAMKFWEYGSAKDCAASLANAIQRQSTNVTDIDSAGESETLPAPDPRSGVGVGQVPNELTQSASEEEQKSSPSLFRRIGRRRLVLSVVVAILALMLIAFAAYRCVGENHMPYWGVWVGTYRDSSSAELQSDKLKAAGFDSVVEVTSEWDNLNTDTWYAVSAGRFASQTEAEHQLEAVKSAGFENAYVRFTGSYRVGQSGGPDETARDETLTIVLTPDEKLSPEEIEADFARLKGRLDALVGEGLYEMTINADSATLVVPKTCFGDVEAKNVLRCYLTRPIELSLGGLHSVIGGELLEVTRTDIVSMEVVDGLPDNLASSDLGADYPEGCKAFKLVFSDEFIAKNAKELASWGNDVKIVQDRGESAYFSYEPVARDGNTLYFVERDQGSIPNVLDTVIYNYTHDPLSAPFTFSINWNDLADWQEPGEAASPGSSQRSEEDMEGKLVSLRYSDYINANVGNITEGAELDLEKGLKQRFDALGLPYAFGLSYETIDAGGMARYAVIETEWELLDCRYAYMAASSGHDRIALFFEGNEADLSVDNHSVSVDRNEAGAWYITIMSRDLYGRDEIPKGQLAAFGSQLDEGDEVSFMLGDYVALKARFAGHDESGAYKFERLTTFDGRAVDNPDAEWAVQFYKACLDTWEYLPDNLELKDGLVTEGGAVLTDAPMSFEKPEEYLGVEGAVQKAMPQAGVNFEPPYLKVLVAQPIDDELFKDGLAAARKVFQSVGYRHAEFENVIVYLVDEEKQPGEQASIMMARRIDSYTGVPTLHLTDIVTGQQLGNRSTELDELIEADPFFSAMKQGMSAEKFDEAALTAPSEDDAENAAVMPPSSWNAGIPYKTEFFSLELPASWEGRWECEEGTETREAMSATNYYYSFKLDGVAQFSVECNVFALGPGRIGSTGKRQVEFYPAEVLSDEDAASIRNSITPIPA